MVQKPEIQRAELQSLFLQLVAIRQNPFEFAFIDAPDREASECEPFSDNWLL
jgi:HrpA-like RNA helicase